MTVLKGFRANAAFKHAAAWSTPVVVGALDGLEFLTEGVGASGGTEDIVDLSISGSDTQREADAGNRLFDGPMSFAARYEGLEPILAHMFGVGGVPTTVDVSGRQHDLKLNPDMEGIFGTLVIDKKLHLHEFPTVKVLGLGFKCASGQRAEVTPRFSAFDLNLNTTALATPGVPIVTPTGTPGAVTYSYRIVARNYNGQTLPGTAGQTTTGNAVLSSTNYNAVSWTAVPGATSYDVYGRTSGTELFIANVATNVFNDQGVVVTPVGALPVANTTAINTQAGFASVTLPTNREFLQYSQMVVRLNAQAGAALALPTDRLDVTEFNVDIDRKYKMNEVTTEYGNRISEPLQDGFGVIAGNLVYTRFSDANPGANHPSLLSGALLNTRYKMDVTFTAAALAGSTVLKFSWTFFFPNIQLGKAVPVVAGPGVPGWTQPFTAWRVTAAPTGFPAAAIAPVMLRIVSQRAGDPLT